MGTPAPEPAVTAAPAPIERETLAPSVVGTLEPSSDTLAVEGWVSRTYTCPPCPPDALCKPCMGNNLVLSEENKRLADWTLATGDLLVFTGDMPHPDVGTRVVLDVMVAEGVAPNGSTPYIKRAAP